jgi:hypothetical protein
VELFPAVVEMMLVMLEFYKLLEREVMRCPYRTGSCRAFCEEAVQQIACVALRLNWPLGHCYTSLDSPGIFW